MTDLVLSKTDCDLLLDVPCSLGYECDDTTHVGKNCGDTNPLRSSAVIPLTEPPMVACPHEWLKCGPDWPECSGRVPLSSEPRPMTIGYVKNYGLNAYSGEVEVGVVPVAVGIVRWIDRKQILACWNEDYPEAMADLPVVDARGLWLAPSEVAVLPPECAGVVLIEEMEPG